uniref:Uncharacterized protein n=1 Tax=Romanomermis culicivorax TaxID=13658 RepID=A0A915IZX2_ROMCU
MAQQKWLGSEPMQWQEHQSYGGRSLGQQRDPSLGQHLGQQRDPSRSLLRATEGPLVQSLAFKDSLSGARPIPQLASVRVDVASIAAAQQK